jgi:ribosomal protein L20
MDKKGEVVTNKKQIKHIKEGIENYRGGKTKKFKTAKEAVRYLDNYVREE